MDLLQVAHIIIPVMLNNITHNNYCIFYSDTRETTSEGIEVTKIHVYKYICNGK